ncbi:DUF397 domain-containing protein [Nocardiopsis sp. NPDC058789]|uniref:DUF397 domain-containing protein n=1 Tax=Nocardiopsis eucommiae TaxID=2831970 RepID=A0A975LAH2_9ACTN|nr:DUF397 domain-containing protein [Nocardiopsis eucommiae]
MDDSPPWFKSSFSQGASCCVEALVGQHGVSARDSRAPDGTRLGFVPVAWSSFLGALRS